MNIYLLIGLPGSGKTTWLKNAIGIVFDDISQMKNGLSDLQKAIEDNKKKDIFIADVNFCNLDTLQLAMYKIQSFSKDTINFKYVIFEADKEILYNNVKYRNDGRLVSATIENMSKRISMVNDFLKNMQNKNNIIVINTPKMRIKPTSI